METILFLPSCDCLRYYNLQWITSNQCDESRWNLHGVKLKSEWKWDYVSTQEVLWQGVCMAQLASRGYCSLQTQCSLKINVSGRRIIDIDASINVTFSAEAPVDWQSWFKDQSCKPMGLGFFKTLVCNTVKMNLQSELSHSCSALKRAFQPNWLFKLLLHWTLRTCLHLTLIPADLSYPCTCPSVF